MRYLSIILAIVWFAGCTGFTCAQSSADLYVQELKKLDDSRPESVCVARDDLRMVMPKADAYERERMFRAFRSYYIHSVRATAKAFSAAMDRYTNDYEQWLTKTQSTDSARAFLRERPDVAKTGAAWFDCGFLMYDSEGNLYPDTDPDFLPMFSAQLGPGLADYVRFRASEDREKIMDDAALQISWEQLRMRLERWETFEREHPTLPEIKSEVEPEIQALARVYFFGSDNTPIYDSSSGRFHNDLVKSWSEFADHDVSSRYHRLMSRLLQNMRGGNQTMTQADRALFERAGMGQDFDNWWKWSSVRMKRQ